MLKNKLTVFAAFFACIFLLTACTAEYSIPDKPVDIDGIAFEERVETQYADKFAIDRYEGGYSVIYTSGGDSYLIVPEGKEAPGGIAEDIKIIRCPADNIYLAATSAMTYFDLVGSGNSVRFSGTKAEDWYIDYAKEALQNGDMLYAGKYREPDYELLLAEGCKLAVESTMILHTPEVKEKLEELGISVFIDYSSYEPHPLGRSEWIKVYGEMLGKQEEAKKLFNEQAKLLNTFTKPEDSGKTAVFFYINSNGQAVTRKPGDYITKMLEIAGCQNALSDVGADTASSSVTMEAEEFYTKAKDADFIIYNSSIGGEITTLDELNSKSSLLADFKAVREGNVWCTKNNLFQETMKLGEIITDFNAIFTDKTEENPPKYLYRLRGGESVE